MFQIGDKVVCVDDRFYAAHLVHHYSGLPVKGVVYVVRGTYGTVDASGPGVYVVGIFADIDPETGLERGFRQFRFRKLEDLKNEARERQRKEEPTTA